MKLTNQRFLKTCVLTFLLAAVAWSGPAVHGLSYDSTDAADKPLLLGDEIMAFQFDADDRLGTIPGSVQDVSGNGAWAASMGGPAFSASSLGYGDALVGTPGAYLDVQNLADLPEVGNAFTVSLWLRQVEQASGYIMLTTDERPSHGFSVTTIGSALYVLQPKGTAWLVTDTGYRLPLDQWVHVALAGEGTSLKVYANGVLVRHMTTATDLDPWTGGLRHVRIGNHAQFTNQYFAGQIDELRIYGRVISPAEILRLAYTPYHHANVAPVADAGPDLGPTCDAVSGLATVSLDGSGSFDAEGDVITHSWAAASAATVTDPMSAVATATFPYGMHEATLTVDDTEDSDTDSTTIAVVDDSPATIGVIGWNAGMPLEDQPVLLGPTDFSVQAFDMCSGVARVDLVMGDELMVSDDEAPYVLTYEPAFGPAMVTGEVRVTDHAGNVATMSLGDFVAVGLPSP